MIIVSDASPLISFAILDKLAILDELFDKIYIPPAVYNEITFQDKPFADKLKSFASNRVKDIQNTLAVELLQKDLDRGESEAIVLAKENNIADILMDEHKGRRLARVHNLFPIGTIGVLIQAKKKGIISIIKPELDTLIANHRRISKELYDTALELAGEK